MAMQTFHESLDFHGEHICFKVVHFLKKRALSQAAAERKAHSEFD